jgi:hypothetical protein
VCLPSDVGEEALIKIDTIALFTVPFMKDRLKDLRQLPVSCQLPVLRYTFRMDTNPSSVCDLFLRDGIIIEMLPAYRLQDGSSQ